MSARTAKAFLDYDDQINLLRQQGLCIDDVKGAKATLSHIGYYELINGYKTIFKDSVTRRYKAETTFEDIVALYKCDENLRELFFKYILRIEIHLRSRMSYVFTELYGTDQKTYLDPKRYREDPSLRGEIRHLIRELDQGANRSNRTPYVTYQRKTYGNVPLWVLFKSLTLGTLIRFYRCAGDEVREATAKGFPDVRSGTLLEMLELMNDFRNVCAHNECLYACRSDERIPPMPCLRRVHLPRDADGRYDGNDLFAMLIVFSYLLTREDFARCKSAIGRILDHFFVVCPHIKREELYEKMGFPSDWEAL